MHSAPPVLPCDGPQPIPPPDRWFTRARLPVVLAVALTLLNALKPLHVDDTAYYAFAHHLAEHPGDPYGFQTVYMGAEVPANHILAPPVLPYWWSLAVRLFGTHPVLWKLWLLPFSLILSLSLAALLRRLAPSYEGPLLCLTILSPTILPALNLMLDVPALALTLLAVALFLRAADHDRMGLALASGLVAGLAMQTKYTAAVAVPVVIAYAGLVRRYRLGMLAALAAVLVFAAWEAFLAWRYGESHFLLHWQAQGKTAAQRIHLVMGLVTMVGGLAPAAGLLGLAALGRRWALIWGTIVVGLAFLYLADGPGKLEQPVFTLDRLARVSGYDVLFGAMGVFVLGIWGVVAWTLLRLPASGDRSRRCQTVFLLVWLAIEVLGYLFITPFPAARRVMGIVLVGTLLVGHLAARVGADRGMFWPVSLVGAMLGLLYFYVDLREAVAEMKAAATAADWIRQRQPHAVAWYTGSWGFAFQAEQEGLQALVVSSPAIGPGRPPTVLHRGDWLVLPDPAVPQPAIRTDPHEARLVHVIEITDHLPLRTLASPRQGSYYGGRAPLRRLIGPRFQVTVWRVTADFVPHD